MKLSVRFSLILLAAFILLCSCSGESAEIIPEFDTAAGDSFNYNGMEIVFLSDTPLFFRYEDFTPSYDAIMKRIKEVEKKYNCKIIYNSTGSLESLVTSAAVSADRICDAIFMDGLPFRNLSAGGYLLDFSAYSDIIDINDSFRWGTKNVLEICSANGHLYGVTPAAWVDKLAPYYFLVVTNNDIVMKNGYPHPHEFYENGTWNRSVFAEMVSTCADLERNIYGIDTSNGFIGRMAVYSDGIGLVDNSSATSRSTWHSSLVQYDLQWAADFIAANSEYITQDGESYDKFVEGNSAMALPAIHHFCRKIIYTTAMESYSLMPFPCSDAVEPGTCGGFFSTGLDTISLPVFTTNERETATVINDIFAPMDGNESSDALDSYYISNVFFSSTDLEIYKKCMANTRYNYWVEGANAPLENIINNVISGKYTPSQAIDAYIETADEYIINIIVPNEEGLKEYFTN